MRRIFAEELVGVSIDMVQPSSRIADLRSKSDEWALVGVVLALECEFAVRIHADDLDTLATVGDFVDYICKLKGE